MQYTTKKTHPLIFLWLSWPFMSFYPLFLLDWPLILSFFIFPFCAVFHTLAPYTDFLYYLFVLVFYSSPHLACISAHSLGLQLSTDQVAINFTSIKEGLSFGNIGLVFLPVFTLLLLPHTACWDILFCFPPLLPYNCGLYTNKLVCFGCSWVLDTFLKVLKMY